MGIYDKQRIKLPSFKFAGVKGIPDLHIPLMALAILFVLALFLVQVFFLFSPKALAVSFGSNPLVLNKDSSTMADVSVFNIVGEDVSKAVVSLHSVDERAFIVFPPEKDLGVLAKHGYKRTEFVVRANPAAGVPKGDYAFVAEVNLDGRVFEERVNLKVE